MRACRNSGLATIVLFTSAVACTNGWGWRNTDQVEKTTGARSEKHSFNLANVVGRAGGTSTRPPAEHSDILADDEADIQPDGEFLESFQDEVHSTRNEVEDETQTAFKRLGQEAEELSKEHGGYQQGALETALNHEAEKNEVMESEDQLQYEVESLSQEYEANQQQAIEHSLEHDIHTNEESLLTYQHRDEESVDHEDIIACGARVPDNSHHIETDLSKLENDRGHGPVTSPTNSPTAQPVVDNELQLTAETAETSDVVNDGEMSQNQEVSEPGDSDKTETLLVSSEMSGSNVEIVSSLASGVKSKVKKVKMKKKKKSQRKKQKKEEAEIAVPSSSVEVVQNDDAIITHADWWRATISGLALLIVCVFMSISMKNLQAAPG